MRGVRILIVVIFFAVVLSPWAKVLVLPKHDLSLGGETNKVKEVSLSLDTLLDGSFQKSFLRWFKRNFGLRPFLIRTDNQINFTFFNQLSSNYRSTAILGKNNNLFERAYLPSASNIRGPKLKRVKNKAAKVKELQSALQQKGVKFLLLVSPSKASFQKKDLPSAYTVDGAEERVDAYEVFISELEKNGVTFFDSRAFLKAHQAKNAFPFFPPSGTHWNDYAACLVSRELVHRSADILDKKLRSFTCEPVKWRDTPSYPERDLSRLVNIWTEDAFHLPSPKPTHKTVKDGTEYRPKILFVGTSFLWAVLRYLDTHRVYRKRHLYYYFRTNHTYPKRKKISIDKDNLDWDSQVFSNDLIIIEINEAFVHKAGHGFVKHATDHIGKDYVRAQMRREK